MNSDNAAEAQVIVPLENLRDFIVRCMQKVGTKPDHAEVMADLLVSADHRGHYSHGLNRIDFYLSDIVEGYNAVDKEPEIIKQTVATVLVDGNNCLGPVVGRFCIDLAIEKAISAGIGWVCAKGSNHFGIAGWYSIRAMNQGFIGMAFCNTSPNMIPTRSKMRLLGTNPISVAAKGNNDEEFVLDMATTAVAQGKVEIKHRLGKDVPAGWAVDRHGRVSPALIKQTLYFWGTCNLDPQIKDQVAKAFLQTCTNTEEILYHGGLHPLGGTEETSGYKGYGLGFMVELFCGILSGSAFGSNIRSWSEHSTNADLGQCFVAIDPKAFAPGFEDRLSELIHQCKNLAPADGESEILVPGDPEKQHIQLCSELGGIPYHQKQIDFADEISRKYGVDAVVRL